MKILSSEHMKAWDSYTIQKEPISSYNLMERAGKKCFNEIIKQFPKKRFHIIVNKGNNGGDGLVILRHLIQITKKARLTIIDISKNETKDFTKNLKLIEKHSYRKIKHADELIIDNGELIIDCIFGTGLNKSIISKFAEIVYKINQSK